MILLFIQILLLIGLSIYLRTQYEAYNKTAAADKQIPAYLSYFNLFLIIACLFTLIVIMFYKGILPELMIRTQLFFVLATAILTITTFVALQDQKIRLVTVGLVVISLIMLTISHFFDKNQEKNLQSESLFDF